MSFCSQNGSTKKSSALFFELEKNRRDFLLGLNTCLLLISSSSMIANAVIMDISSSEDAQMFSSGSTLSIEFCKDRFKKAEDDLQYLLNHFDTVVNHGGGDNVRRYLGTVGVTSNLYGIQRVLKQLQEEADDIVEYTENMNEFDAALRAADTSCYSANFVEYSAAKTKPEQFFADAKRETKQMLYCMQNMAKELKI